MACIHFKPEDKPDHKALFADAFFAKFNVKDQMQRLNRVAGKSTIEWWSKQCQNAKTNSFIPCAADELFEDGYERMRQWAKEKNDPTAWVFARGNLDQLVLDDIEEQIGLEPVFKYERWRDVRTAVDFLYDTHNGYVKVETPPWMEHFDPALHITKHKPVDDCVFDAMMLMYGVRNE